MRRIIKRRVGGGGGGGAGGGISPLTILGSLLSSDFDVADPNVTLNAGNVASIPNRGTDGAPLAQAAGGLQPAFSATSFAGGPGMTFDGVDDTLLCTLNTAIAIGRRPYLWVVWQNADLVAANRIAASAFGAPATPYLVAWSNRADGNQGGGLDMNNGGGATTGVNPATAPTHLQECCPIPGGATAFLRDNVASAGAAGACTTSGTAITSVRASGFGVAVAQLTNAVVRRIILANDQPSAAQITAMRAYIRAQPYGLTF